MRQGDSAYLRHILDAVSRIDEYTEDMKREDFMSSNLHQDAVIRQVEVIGEAARKVSEETRKRHTEVPWKDMAGMRDKLIHGYFGVDLDAVWDTVTEDIPRLKAMIQGLLG